MVAKVVLAVFVLLFLMASCDLLSSDDGREVSAESGVGGDTTNPSNAGVSSRFVESFAYSGSDAQALGTSWDVYKAQGTPAYPTIGDAAGWGEAIAYGAGVYVIVGGSATSPQGDFGTIYWSADAVNWTNATPSRNSQFNDIVWTGERFIAVGLDGIVAESTDGRSWQSYWIAGFPTFEVNLKSVAVSPDRVVIGGFGGLVYDRARTSTGAWSATRFEHPGTLNLIGPSFQEVAWDGWEFLLGGHHSLGTPIPVLWWSRTGVRTDWFIVEFLEGSFWQPPVGLDARRSVVSLARFGGDATGVTLASLDGGAVNQSFGTNKGVFYSDDWGGSWNRITGIDGSILVFDAIAPGPGRVVAASDAGTLYYSDDGRVWTAVTTPAATGDASLPLRDLIYAPDTETAGSFLFIGFKRGTRPEIWISAAGS